MFKNENSGEQKRQEVPVLTSPPQFSYGELLLIRKTLDDIVERKEMFLTSEGGE